MPPVFSKPLEAVRGAKPEHVRKVFFEEVITVNIVNGKEVKTRTGEFKCLLCAKNPDLGKLLLLH